MKPTSPNARSHEFRPSRALSQHFLVRSDIVQEIIQRSRFKKTDLVIEIGPGKGSLTIPLSRTVGRVVAVEKDPRLVRMLEEKLLSLEIRNVTLVCEDILKFELHKMLPPSGGGLKIIGNLPYNISSPVLERLVKLRQRLSKAVLMLQSEFAARLLASPGTKDYGALTVWTRYHAQPALLLKVPRRAFSPRPKVDSMVLELDFERPYPRRTEHERHFRDVVKASFSHRRKMILNSLCASWPEGGREEILKALGQCRIDPKRRAETLSLEEFLDLSKALPLTDDSSDDR